MKILINYADEKYKKTQHFNSWTGKHFGGFDKVIEYGPENIDVEYRENYKEIFAFSRGNGLWLWKPYFILRTLNESLDGDYIFYSDSGAFFIRNVDSLIESMTGDVWVSDVPLLEKSFTKGKCFDKLGCSDNKYKDSNQIQGTFLLFRNSKASRAFVEEWLHLCEDIELLEPAAEHDENGALVSHREDQSILSLLCKKRGIIPHRDPSHRGKYLEWYDNGKYPFVVPEHNDTYKSILFLHKTPNVSVSRCLIDYCKCIRAHANRGGAATLKSIVYTQIVFDLSNCCLNKSTNLLPGRMEAVIC